MTGPFPDYSLFFLIRPTSWPHSPLYNRYSALSFTLPSSQAFKDLQVEVKVGDERHRMLRLLFLESIDNNNQAYGGDMFHLQWWEKVTACPDRGVYADGGILWNATQGRKLWGDAWSQHKHSHILSQVRFFWEVYPLKVQKRFIKAFSFLVVRHVFGQEVSTAFRDGCRMIPWIHALNSNSIPLALSPPECLKVSPDSFGQLPLYWPKVQSTLA